MAYQIFYDILNEIAESGEKERIERVLDLIIEDRPYCSSNCSNIIDWCEEQLDLMGIPEGMFRTSYIDGLKDAYKESGELRAIIDHIIEYLVPALADLESESSETTEEDEEEESTAS